MDEYVLRVFRTVRSAQENTPDAQQALDLLLDAAALLAQEYAVPTKVAFERFAAAYAEYEGADEMAAAGQFRLS